MINHSIISERSVDHWPYLNVKGKNVLDLGCGRHQTYEVKDHSPCYFLDQGASKVIAIDASQEEINYYESIYGKENPTFYAECAAISDPVQVLNYITKYDITALKCDIEGYETALYDITKDQMKGITDIAIEYHDNDRRENVLRKYNEWGFELIAEGLFTYCHAPNMGVLFAKR
jgi:hypothetical protein